MVAFSQLAHRATTGLGGASILENMALHSGFFTVAVLMDEISMSTTGKAAPICIAQLCRKCHKQVI